MTPSKKEISKVLKISAGLTIAYFIMLIALKISACNLTLNEFGDYVGGVLNPFFTLLSTSAIIYLTYLIAKNETTKADESIVIQKRIILNQMRQEALNNLSEKLNLFAYKLDEIPVHDVKPGSLIQRILTRNEEKQEVKSYLVWIIIHFELQGFIQLNYLFRELFDNDEFNKTFQSLSDTIGDLAEEQSSYKIITKLSLEKYIGEKQNLQTLIGDFIISEF